MDLSSITSALLSLQNQPGDQSSMGAIAAEDGQKAAVEADAGAGQDLPSADAAGAASATSGASSAALSAEMQALLLQAQEASAASSLLLGQSDAFGGDPLLGTASGAENPMIAAIAGTDEDGDDGFTFGAGSMNTELLTLLNHLQRSGNSTITSDSSRSAALMQTVLGDFLNSASANTRIDASNQTLFDLMGDETEPAGLAE